MSRDFDPEGGIAPVMLVGGLVVAAAVTIYCQYWWISVPATVGVAIVIIFVVKKRNTAQANAAAELREALNEGLTALVRMRGRTYVTLMAAAIDALATGERPTFVGFQRRLGITRATSRAIMNDLEALGVVTPTVKGRRRTTAVNADALRIVADTARNIASTLDAPIPAWSEEVRPQDHGSSVAWFQ